MTRPATAAPSDRPAVVGLLLASGFGRRFDAAGRRNKLLARLPDGRPIVAAAAAALCEVLDEVAVVVPAGGGLVEAALSDLPVQLIHNGRAENGIGASIAVGIATLRRDRPQSRGWLIALGDMPFILPTTIAALAAALVDTGTSIVAPGVFGRRGHPVGFARGLDDELVALDGDSGAQSLLQRHPVHLVECGDPGVLHDIDTIEDLARAAGPGGTPRRPT